MYVFLYSYRIILTRFLWKICTLIVIWYHFWKTYYQCHKHDRRKMYFFNINLFSIDFYSDVFTKHSNQFINKRRHYAVRKMSTFVSLKCLRNDEVFLIISAIHLGYKWKKKHENVNLKWGIDLYFVEYGMTYDNPSVYMFFVRLCCSEVWLLLRNHTQKIFNTMNILCIRGPNICSCLIVLPQLCTHPIKSTQIGWKDGDSFYEQRLAEILISKNNYIHGLLMNVVTPPFYTDLTT